MFTTLLFTLLLYNKLFNVLYNKLYNNRNVNACHLCILIIVKCINEHLIKNKKSTFELIIIMQELNIICAYF